MRPYANFLAQNTVKKNRLEFWTNVPVDDQFSSPKQIRWSAAMGKLLVSQAGVNVAVFHLGNADLSFYSKYYPSLYACVGIDADLSSYYLLRSYSGASGLFKRIYKVNFLTPLNESVYSSDILSLRMIDASGDPDYAYVTSNNAVDHHGFRQVKKSTMAVTASALADGSGDGQFDDPLGIFYYNSEVFVADYDNSRISVWTKSGETLTYNRKYDLGFKPMDLCFDGTNWYVQSATNTYKYDAVFTDATKISTACVGYSITYIPDQSDGYGATLGIVDSTNSHIERRKCSDLSAINSVGSAGDGSSSLFDPTFTTSTATTITYQFDDGFSYTTPSGTSHALSWNGFAGYSFRSAGPHKCTVRVNGGLGLVTGIDCNTDAITVIKNLNKCRSCGNYLLNANSELKLDLSVFAGKSFITFWAHSGNSLTGAISNLKSYSDLRLSGNNIYGSLSDLFASATLVWINYMSGFVPASIAHLVAIRDLRIYNMGWTAQQNTDVILSAWNARANYTYASNIALRISAPTGTPGTEPPVEAGPGHDTSDWAWNAVTSRYDPLTGYAAIADLQNDFYGEGFKIWIITIQ